MDKKRALELLTGSKPELEARFGATRLALFGSTARDTATSSSDIDVLVAFDGSAAPSTWLPRRPYALSCVPALKESKFVSDTFQRKKRGQIYFPSRDLEALQRRALEEGLPYQTLVSSVLHKYVSGGLKDISANKPGQRTR